MNKSLLVLLLICSQTALAGDIGNNNSYSPDYLRTLSRNATTEVDAAFYNPAGLTYLEDGLHLQLSNQMWDVLIDIHWRDDTYTSRGAALIIPSAAIVYTTHPFAFFLTYGPKAANGSANVEPTHPYLTQAAENLLIDMIGSDDPDTLALLENRRADLELSYLSGGVTAGVSYQPSKHIAWSAGIAVNFMQARMLVDAEYQFMQMDPTSIRIDALGSGTGVGVQFGVHIRPNDDLDMSINYFDTTALTLKWEKAEDTTNLLPEKQRRDIPPYLAVGLAYRFLEQFETSCSLTYYMNTEADWGENPEDQTPLMKLYDDGIDLGVSLQYSINTSWDISGGYNRSWTGAVEASRNLIETGLDANSFTLGARFHLNENLSFSGALTYIGFIDGTNTDETIDYEAITWGGGFGISWKAL